MKILAAIDQTECTPSVIDFILKHKWSPDVGFRLFSVVEPVNGQYLISGGDVRPMVDSHLEEVRLRWIWLQSEADALRKQLPRATIDTKLVEGQPADCIVAEARSWAADLILVGCRGYHGVRKFLLGSVSAAVLGHASCPVTIVKNFCSLPEVKKGISDGSLSA